MFRKSIQRCMLSRARFQLAAATAAATKRGIIHECSIKAGDGMNGRLFESQMLAASNSVHQTYDVISLSSLKSQVKLGDLDKGRSDALVKLSEKMKILKKAEKAKQELQSKKDKTKEQQKPGKGGNTKMEQTPERDTVGTVMKDVQCDFVAIMKTAADEQWAMQGMNDFCRRTADEVAVLTLKPHEEKQEQETPTLSKVVEDNFFVADETSVPTKVLMEITVASTFFELQRKLYQLVKADAYLDCVEGKHDLPRRLLVVAINSNKGTADESIKKLFEPDQVDFRELVRRALQPDATEDDPVQVVVLWAPFRNIYDEMHGMNQKVDDLRKAMKHSADLTNSRMDKLDSRMDNLSTQFKQCVIAYCDCSPFLNELQEVSVVNDSVVQSKNSCARKRNTPKIVGNNVQEVSSG